MDNFIILIIVYSVISLLIALHSSLKESNFRWRFFFAELSLAWIALLLMPLILNSLGNTTFSVFLDDEQYRLLQVIAYSSAIALGGKKVVSIALEKLNLSNVKDDIEKNKNKVNHLEDAQEALQAIVKESVIREVETSFAEENTLKTKEFSHYKEFLVAISGENEILVNDENLSYLLFAEKQRHINIYGEPKLGSAVKFKMTKIGSLFSEANEV